MEIFLIIVSSILLVTVLALSALVYTMSKEAVHALERSHQRMTGYTEGLVDRVMSADFAEFKAHQLTERATEPEEEPPELGYDVIGGDDNPDRGGFGSKLGLRALSVREQDALEEISE